MIGLLTLVSRFVGFGRIFVFGAVIGATTLGNLYQSVNTLPNIVFEIVAGGALASVVVPLLSGAVERQDSAIVDRTSSALLTWAVAVLTPLAIAVGVLAEPIVTALVDDPAANEVGTRMLRVFAPQLVLYGVGIVLTGVLQAHHRFAGPALAPLLSSVTVIGAYLLFGVVAGSEVQLDEVTLPAELILSVGTTLGVAVLSLCLLVPLRGTGVRLRPTFRFPAGEAAQARALVGSGIVTVVGQQLALLVVLKLAQPPAPVGAMVAYTLTQTLFFLPWAVLAVPVATSAFPRMAAAHSAGDLAVYRRTVASSTRAVLLLSAVAAAALVAAAEPIGEVVAAFLAGEDDPAALAWAVAAFAPGLLGYGLLALLTRALYAAGVTRATALATTIGWVVVIAADIALALLLPTEHRVAALAAGHTAGMTVLGVALLVLTARRAGPGSLDGVVRAGIVALVAAVAAAGAGLAAGTFVGGSGVVLSVAQGILVGAVVLVVFGAVAALADPHDVRPMLRRAARRPRSRKNGART